MLPSAKAKRYLEDVLVHKQAIPFRRFCGGVGPTAQAKNRYSNGQGRCVVKSARFNALKGFFFLGFLLFLFCLAPYMSSPCHIKLILSEKEPVKKEPETQLAPQKTKGQALRSGASS